MKRFIPTQRIATGTVALAILAGFNVTTNAEDGNIYHVPESLPIAMLSDIEATEYSSVQTEPGIAGEVELVRERYQDGKVRIERQVALNGEGNYVNHGAWKMYSPNGDVIAEGQFNFGERIGLWTRWNGQKDSPTFNDFPFNKFKAPFMSQAHFTAGKMDGEWTISDANERKIMIISLKAGERNGPTTVFLPNGKIHSQTSYEYAVPVGDLLELNEKSGQLAHTATYVEGRKVITDTKYFPGTAKQKKSEIMYLAAKTTLQSPDEYWTVKLAKFAADGKDLRHGTSKTWYRSGKPETDGFYQYGKKAGTFTYWHENGQVAATGEYRDDLAEGTWVWWHSNGQKSAIGKYQTGALIGDWRWWNDEGKLTKQQTYDGTEKVTNQDEKPLDLTIKPAMPKTKTRRH
jgi:antitoxin component YwqK of YwqJK toxin-antitoxin module